MLYQSETYNIYDTVLVTYMLTQSALQESIEGELVITDGKSSDLSSCLFEIFLVSYLV